MSRPSLRAARTLAWTWAALTTSLLLLPGPSEASARPLPAVVQEGLEFAAHFVLFAVLAWLVRRSAFGTPARWIPAFLVAYCASLELLQLLVPHRGFEFLDIVFGWLGLWLGWGQARAARSR